MATTTAASTSCLFFFTIFLLLSLEATEARIHSQAYRGNLNSVESTVKVTFRLHKHVEFGQGFVVAGNISELGNWDTSKAPLLSNLDADNWKGVVNLASGSRVEFKVARVVYDNPSQVLEWYGDENVVLLVPSEQSSTVLLQLCSSSSSSSSSSSKEVQKKVGSVSIVSVQFQIKKKIKYGERLGISGGHSSLGDWTPEQALLMDAVTDDFWVSTKNAELESGSVVPYKALIVDYDTNALLEWMPGQNRKIEIPSDIEDELAIVLVTWSTCSSSTILQDTITSELQTLLGI